MNESIISFDVSKGSCHYQAFVDFKKPIFKPKKLKWTLESFENLQKDIQLLKSKSSCNLRLKKEDSIYNYYQKKRQLATNVIKLSKITEKESIKIGPFFF